MAFLDDYYCTSETWSVKKSARARARRRPTPGCTRARASSPYRYDKDRGYVCTFSALVLKATTAHLFHVGDARIYRLQPAARLEQLTAGPPRAGGAGRELPEPGASASIPQLEIDYRALEIERGDVFVLATDGVYEHVDAAFVAQAIREARGNLDEAARAIVAEAYRRGSADNLTVQIVSRRGPAGAGGAGCSSSWRGSRRRRCSRRAPRSTATASCARSTPRARSHIYLADELRNRRRASC